MFTFWSNATFVLLLRILLLFSTHDLTGAQLPAVCTNPENFHKQICCPVPFVGAGPCGSLLKPPRGKCVNVTTKQDTTDVRGNWPHYYNNVCKCRPQFGNFDCGECAYEFKGATCDKKAVKTRRFLNQLTQDEIDDFVRILYMAKSFPSRYVVISRETRPGTMPPMRVGTIQDVFVWIHYYISKESYVYDFGHGGPAFPVWHRHYLMWFEREIRWMLGGDKEFAIPFWDWTSEENRMFPFKEHILGASDKHGSLIGNFANWTVVCYIDLDHLCDPNQDSGRITRFGNPEAYAANYTKWPTRDQVCNALTKPTYDTSKYNTFTSTKHSFRNNMEGFIEGEVTKLPRRLHNQVHDMIDGTLTNVPIASNDPIFILHHSFVDYILEMWIRRHHGKYQPPPEDTSAAKGHNYNDYVVPFLPLIQCHELLVDSKKYGWTYESLIGLDLESKSCVQYDKNKDLEVLYPKSLHNSSQVALSEDDNDQVTASDKQLESKLDEKFNIVPKNNDFTITSKNSLLSAHALLEHPSDRQRVPAHNICTFTSNKVVFQIPSNCDKVVFQSNLVLPKKLIPSSWYLCSPLQTPSRKTSVQNSNKINPHILYICDLLI